jgi:hypothetical protein
MRILKFQSSRIQNSQVSFLTSIYIFGVLHPLRSDQIKLLPLILSNMQHFLLLSSAVTVTTCFSLSSDHRQVFAPTLMYALCLTSNVNLKILTYGIELWGCSKPSNTKILQMFQSKTLRKLNNAPWYISNITLHPFY